jgi:hypothetical protein
MLQQNKITQNNTIPYAVNGCYVLRPDQMDLLNTRVQKRYQTDIPLAPSFDPRPVQTKYTRFGVLDEYKTVETSIEPDYYKDWNSSVFNQNHQQPFTAPTLNGPPLAYFMNLDKETALQRQGAYMFNSKNGEDDSIYQPSHKSDLYQNTIFKYSGYGGSGEYSPTENTPYLFDQYSFSTTREAPDVSQTMPFNNPTLPRGTGPEY